MAFQLQCLSGVTSYEKEELFFMIRQELGEPVVGVEIDDSQLEVSFCKAIREYSHFINQWALENRMSQMLGLPREIDFTLKYVSSNFSLERSYAKAYSEQVGIGMDSSRELKTGFITLTAGTQDYYIPAGREINEILWFTPSFINLFGLDAYANSNLSYHEFGASFAGHSLYYIMPLFDTLLTSQAAELRNKVRASEYSYRLVAGPSGTKKLSLYPIPRTPSDNYGLVGASTPGVVFYRYYDTVGVAGNPAYSGYTANPGYTGGTWSQGNGLVSGPSDAQLNFLTYAELNSNAKYWVQKFALAIAMRILGLSIRGKFSGTLPIPDAELTLNSDALLNTAKEDMDKLKEELKAELEKLNFKALLENNAMMQENINKTLGFVPLGIYLG
mgnify:CR=1 FL=1|jgi:hypothetical protein